MTRIRVVISGAGIGGPVAAYFLRRLKISMSITVVERAKSVRATGQNIDIRGPAIDIIRRMGIEEAIRAKNTTEEGLLFVDGSGQTIASFPMSDSSGSLTHEFEILRGDLANILYDSSCEKSSDTHEQTELHYIFNDSIRAIEQKKSSALLGLLDIEDREEVHVRLMSGEDMTCDLLILADGLFSATRPMVFGREHLPGNHAMLGGEDREEAGECIQSLGQYAGLFTMSQIPGVTNNDKFARWCNASRGRLIMIRPDPYGTVRVLLGVTRSDLDKFHDLSANRRDTESAKKLFREEFKDAGWISDQILDGMDAADDFYFQLTAQVKMKELVSGRVALLGDSGYCPSPISGKGTTLAIIGAHTLSDCLSKITSNADMPLALQEYAARMAPVAKEAQRLIPGAPWIVSPQTKIGIKILNTFIWAIGSTASAKKGLERFLEGNFSKLSKSSNEIGDTKKLS